MSQVQPAPRQPSPPEGQAPPPQGQPLRPKTPGRLPPLSPLGLRPRDELQMPAAAGPVLMPLHPEPDHAVEFAPAYRPTGVQATSAELDVLQARLVVLKSYDEIFSAWAAVPIAAWGGLTLAGCVFHFHFLTAAFMAVLTMTGCALPFAWHGRMRRFGVGAGVAFSLLGWPLLHTVGGILTYGTNRVLIWLMVQEQSDTASGTSVAINLLPSVDNFLAAAAIGLVLLLTLVSLYQAVRFVFHERKKVCLIERIEIEAARLECEIAKQAAARRRLG
ncbi:MAG TPA: hypothetical protein VL860_12390 [Planctomycetota bacterium]|nr:hypothetical protein [Planctomycetota bacterium]